jgi:uracil-DNA glycosylase
MDRLDVIEQILTCSNCELVEQCKSPVPFRGSPTRLAVVGEAPGETEDEVGKPFVGPAGRLLGSLFHEAGITEAMGVLNTVSCFPHGTPTPDQVGACEHNKWTQIDHLNPTYILLTGQVALTAMRRELQIRTARNRPFLVRGRICWATYHPAAALRNGAREDDMRADLARFAELLAAPPDDWMDFIPDTCAGCGLEPEWYEDTGLGWCRLHLPSSQTEEYNRRQGLLLAQAHDARQRASQARDVAVAQVEAGADPDWLAEAYDELVRYLRHNPEFFVDDFWQRTQIQRPRESRALGPVVMKAAREGLMEKSGEFRKSVASNMTEKPVWRSLIYRGASLEQCRSD